MQQKALKFFHVFELHWLTTVWNSVHTACISNYSGYSKKLTDDFDAVRIRAGRLCNIFCYISAPNLCCNMRHVSNTMQNTIFHRPSNTAAVINGLYCSHLQLTSKTNLVIWINYKDIFAWYCRVIESINYGNYGLPVNRQSLRAGCHKRFQVYKENACHFLPLQFAYI